MCLVEGEDIRDHVLDLEHLRPGQLAKVIVKPPFKVVFRQTTKDWERK